MAYKAPAELIWLPLSLNFISFYLFTPATPVP